MKNLILISFINLFITCSIFSQTVPNDTIKEVKDSIEIADGSKISYEEFLKRCNDSFMYAYSQLTEEEIKLFEGVSISVGTSGGTEEIPVKNKKVKSPNTSKSNKKNKPK